MKIIPENFIEFLYWIKNETESLWGQDPEAFHFEKWLHGAKWIGMTNNQIDEVEEKYIIKFTPEHREFLKILHTLDRKEKYEYLDDEELIIEENSFFYNWLEDDEEIKRKLTWPFEEVSRDILRETNHPFWLDSWGKRPESKEEKRKLFTDVFQKSPQLIPIKSHRFVVSDITLKHRPILSIWGTDTIVYGWTLRTYLINELKYYLDIWKDVYDEEDQQYYSDLNDEAQKIHDDDYKYHPSKIIPFWQEIILDYNKSWSSFRLQNPPNQHLESLKSSKENRI